MFRRGDNVQLPTETTEEWEAAPGGVFAPVGPDTSPGGKVKKAVLRRVHPYRRPSPKEPSTVAGAPACAGTGAAVEAVGDRLEKVSLEVTAGPTVGTKRRNGLEYEEALLRTSGAILATTRTGEGHRLPSGNQRTCLPDAAFNAVKTLEPDAKLSLAKLRTAAVPQLGNVLEANGTSVNAAFREQSVPYELRESTARFRANKGGLMLNLLKAAPGAYVAILRVTVENQPNRHAVLVSTIPEAHCALGKLVDNGGAMRPVYIEAKDTMHKPAAKHAFKSLLEQRVGHVCRLYGRSGGSLRASAHFTRSLNVPRLPPPIVRCLFFYGFWQGKAV